MRAAIASLLHNKALIGGNWVTSRSGITCDIVNPSRLEVVGSVPVLTREEAREAIKAASTAQKEWGLLTGKSRAHILRQWYDSVLKHTNALATILTLETGKVFKEAEGEVNYGASYIDWFSEEAKRTYGDIIPPTTNDRQLLVIKQPVGVSCCITSWNFPLALVARKAAPALAAGCCVVIKPSEEAPLSALALADLALQAGVPPGVINVVTCDNSTVQEVGLEFCQHEDVRIISFTGSCAVGKHLMSQASGTVKRMSMELGGNAPFIVMSSANLDLVMKAILPTKFRNAGQTCIASNRFLVHASLLEEFLSSAKILLERLKIGDGFDKDVHLGPLISKQAIEKVERHVKDAVSQGAELLLGGDRLQNTDLPGYFYQPTLLYGLTESMLAYNEETFGPVIAVQSFQTEEEVIYAANQVREGLAGYIFSEDYRQIMRLSHRLEYGMLGVNEGFISSEVIPFGGVKQSGIGREGSKYGIEEYLETKLICLGSLN